MFGGLKTIFRMGSIMKDDKTEKKFYGKAFKFKCEPEDKAESVLNCLVTGYPLPGDDLDGIEIEFIEGPNKGEIWRYVKTLEDK